MSKRNSEGSVAQLLSFCGWYFGLYVFTGFLAKYFTGSPNPKLIPARMSEMAYLYNNTLGSCLLALAVVLVMGWYRMRTTRPTKFGPWTVPGELWYIVISGICAAIIIPGTTLMYTPGTVSVMVAMAIMRGCIVIVSRLIDAVQIRQGLLKKRVYEEENWAVVFALFSLTVNLFFAQLLWAWSAVMGKSAPFPPMDARFDAFHLTVLVLYVFAYSIRLYCMNYYRNTHSKEEQDNYGYFAVEQIIACVVMAGLVCAAFFAGPNLVTSPDAVKTLGQFNHAVTHVGLKPFLSGFPYGALAFFSVFIFMFKGRNATFAGVVNRTTSLLAGTVATILVWKWLGLRQPYTVEWIGTGLLFVAVYFLGRAEVRRAADRDNAPPV